MLFFGILWTRSNLFNRIWIGKCSEKNKKINVSVPSLKNSGVYSFFIYSRNCRLPVLALCPERVFLECLVISEVITCDLLCTSICNMQSFKQCYDLIEPNYPSYSNSQEHVSPAALWRNLKWYRKFRVLYHDVTNNDVDLVTLTLSR